MPLEQGNEEHTPFVSVVVPMLNEIGFIEHCVWTFDQQTYPDNSFEVLVVDGGSTDGSRERISDLALTREWLRLVENPDSRASSAFNRGIEASRGSVLCIVGAHAEVGPTFISKSVAALNETGAAGVGGMLIHQGVDAASNAIGLAMTSKFGMASPFRFGKERRDVDTIGHPAYRREIFDEVGSFDETLERNSDYELNYRIRAAGKRLVLDPDIVTIYRPRGSLGRLARQFYDYGKGKADVAHSHPASLRPRHLVAPAFAALVTSAPLLARSRRGRRLVAASALGYVAVLRSAVGQSQPAKNDASLPVFLAAFPVMHFCWGIGFLRSISGIK